MILVHHESTQVLTVAVHTNKAGKFELIFDPLHETQILPPRTALSDQIKAGTASAFVSFDGHFVEVVSASVNETVATQPESEGSRGREHERRQLFYEACELLCEPNLPYLAGNVIADTSSIVDYN